MSDERLVDCPLCGGSLVGPAIPEEYRQGGFYGPPETAPTHYSNMIGIEIPTVYDGVLYWECPYCHGRWHRWPPESKLYAVAEHYVRGNA